MAIEFAKYGPISLSNPEWETEHVRQLTFQSPALGARGEASFMMPPKMNGALPLIILLHGVYGSHWSWFQEGGAHRTAFRMMRSGELRPAIVAAPSDGLYAHGSAYVNHAGGKFESWIVEDVIGCMQKVVPEIDPANVCIAGLSMGGYGALRLGAKHAAKFKAVAAHSAITQVDEFAQFVPETGFLADVPVEETSVLHWMQKNRSQLPPIRFDCGTEDQLAAGNAALHEEMLRHGIQHEYANHPGGHEWPYWSRHIAETFFFFERVMAAKG